MDAVWLLKSTASLKPSTHDVLCLDFFASRRKNVLPKKTVVQLRGAIQKLWPGRYWLPLV